MRTAALLALTALVTPLSGGTVTTETADVAWKDARELLVEGMGWPEETTGWGRLPDRAGELVRDPVRRLARHTAGITVRFVTDSPAVAAEWTLTSGELAMPHMPATGASGLDLYVRVDGAWRWAHAARPNGITTTATMLRDLEPVAREYMLALPLYNGIESLRIGVEAGSSLEAATPRTGGDVRPIVYYGTSIAQGACASRTGSCHVAILGRRLDRPMINLGFSGNGRLDPELADLLGELDAGVYVIDCLPNLDGTAVAERAAPFVRRLRELRPETPILLVEDRTYSDGWIRPDRARRNRESRSALREAYRELCESGVPNVHYLEGDTLLGRGHEATVDGSHPNDMGFERQADAMEPVLRSILEASVKAVAD